MTESTPQATADPSAKNEELSGTYVPSTREWVRDQVETYERTGGQAANTLLDTGIPVSIVTMRGAKTGAVRKIALMRVEHRGEYALVASAGGAPKHPVWYWNLTAHPDEVLIQDGPKPFRVSVREVEGDERAAWWDRAVAVFPPYAEYQENTNRVIPVLVAAPQDLTRRNHDDRLRRDAPTAGSRLASRATVSPGSTARSPPGRPPDCCCREHRTHSDSAFRRFRPTRPRSPADARPRLRPRGWRTERAAGTFGSAKTPAFPGTRPERYP